MLLVLVVLLFGSPSSVAGQALPQQSDDVFDLAVTKDKTSLSIDDYVQVFVDTTAKVGVADILGGHNHTFIPLANLDTRSSTAALWFRIHLYNSSERELTKLLHLLEYPPAYQLLLVEQDHIVKQVEVTTTLPLAEREHQTYRNLNSVVVPPHVRRTIYLRTQPGWKLTHCCPEVFVLTDPKYSAHERMGRATFQYFYLGIMAIFGLISGLGYLLFRRRELLLLGLLMWSFGLYFLIYTSTHAYIVTGTMWTHRIPLILIVIAAIVGSLSWFVYDYLGLATGAAVPARILRYVSFLVTAIHLLAALVIEQNLAWLPVLNGSLVIWIITVFGLVLAQAHRKQPRARALLISIALLFLGSATWLLELLGWLPNNSIFERGFQLSTIPFAALLFRELFVEFEELRVHGARLRASSDLKSRFFANVTHEFRTPLTLMLGPLRQVKAATQDAEQFALLDLAEQNAERQLALVDQLLALSQFDAACVSLRVRKQDFAAYLRQLTSAYSSHAVQQEISFEQQLGSAPVPLYFNAQQLDQVFHNLLSNAFKFTPAGGRITITLTQNQLYAQVEVSDTGIGIAQDLLPNVFERFTHTTDSAGDTPSTGIGLALVRETVHLHRGKVHVDSRVGEGSTFIIQLPLGHQHLSPTEIEMDTPAQATAPSGIAVLARPNTLLATRPPTRAYGAEDSTLLLVEDNTEMRAFLSLLLAPHYRVKLAVDGAAGLAAALAEPPDLIVSDLMMPALDGYGLCRALKADLRTSHVPVILLTARASSDARVTGLDEGADAYLTKPFIGEELIAQIANLLRTRHLLRARFAGSIVLRPKELAVTSVDQDFLSRALAHVENHLNDPQLSVDHLAKGVLLSRTQLNTKLRALVDQSSNEFIKSVRLQRAAQLLRDRQGDTVAVIAAECGFSSATYFTKLFKAKFGCTPGAYAKDVGAQSRASTTSAG